MEIRRKNMKFLDKFKKKPVSIPAKKEEQKKLTVNEDELMQRAELAIRASYPDIKDLKIWCSSSTYTFSGNVHYLNVSWENGIKECCIADLLNPIIKEFPLDPIFFNITEFYSIYPKRILSDELILATARKYADCISKDLPINMHNVHCFKVGAVPLYELAVGELKLKDVV
jgi:hypothetical protein